jgi:hypothetical protein
VPSHAKASGRVGPRDLKKRDEEIMKSKAMLVVVTMLFAVAMMAQTATPAAPAVGDAASGCACCSHDMANMKAGDKCPMMKDGKMADGKSCCGKDGDCCKDGKCAMKDGKMADGKMCCGAASCCAGDKCPMMKKGKTTAGGSCCAKGSACCKGGTMPCCGRDKAAA